MNWDWPNGGSIRRQRSIYMEKIKRAEQEIVNTKIALEKLRADCPHENHTSMMRGSFKDGIATGVARCWGECTDCGATLWREEAQT